LFFSVTKLREERALGDIVNLFVGTDCIVELDRRSRNQATS
jgi:hypothetical protein